MNQLQNELLSKSVLNPIDYLSNTDKVLQLKERIKRLSDICQDLNPYEEISLDLKNRLAEFHILDLADPFKITNTLLILLEDSIDELHLLQPPSELENASEEAFKKDHEII